MQTAPFFDDIARAPKGGIFEFRTCSDGVRVRVACWKGGDKGTILIFQGRTEFIEKYGPTIQNFLDRGYSVAAIDWRGHGLSDRLSDRPTLGHVEDFKSYQLDVAELLKFVADQNLPENYTVLAHSMGGAVSLRAIQSGLKVDKAIFSAPMWDIAVNSFGDQAIKLYCKTVGKVMSRGKLVPSTHLRNGSFVQDFEGNTFTNNLSEFEFREKQLADHPEIEVGGPSVAWVSEALEDTQKLRQKSMPKIPAICLVGTNEKIVSQKAIQNVMKKWEDGQLIELPNAQHELLIEEDPITKTVWTTIDAFLD